MIMITAPAIVAASGLSGDVFHLVAGSGTLVKAILLLLLGFSVLSWAVILERFRTLRRAEIDSLAFLQDLENERRLSDLRDRAGRYAASPLVPVFVAAFRELTAAVTEGINKFRGSPTIPDEAREKILERVRRRLEEAAAAEAERHGQSRRRRSRDLGGARDDRGGPGGGDPGGDRLQPPPRSRAAPRRPDRPVRAVVPLGRRDAARGRPRPRGPPRGRQGPRLAGMGGLRWR